MWLVRSANPSRHCPASLATSETAIRPNAPSVSLTVSLLLPSVYSRSFAPMPPRKKFKSGHPDEIHEALVALDPPASVLAAGPVLWGMPAEILRLVRRCDMLSFQNGMPADTYGQIALEMTLADLYHLSQMCKDMRVRLWCRSATFIWTDVIKAKAHGSYVPPLPPFLKVHEYIHFLLSSHCYVRPIMPCLSAQHLTSLISPV